MTRISYKRHRFPATVIQHAVWLYFRFTLSFRDVEEMLAQRGIDVSYETIRAWTLKFGPKIAANLRGWMRFTAATTSALVLKPQSRRSDQTCNRPACPQERQSVV